MLVVQRPKFNRALYVHSQYGGKGIGSVLGRLFARVAGRAAKTGIRTAISAGSKIARKGLSTAARKGLTNAVKSTARQTLKKGIRAGKSFAKKQIKTIPKKVLNYAIKKSKDPKTQQKLQKAIAKGARKVVQSIVDNPNSTNRSTTTARILKETATDALKTFLPEHSTQKNPKAFNTFLPPAAAGSRKRKAGNRSRTTPPRKRKRRRKTATTHTSLSSLIARQ